MKIVGINSHPNGSTKTIMVDILDLAEKELECQTYAFWGVWKKGAFSSKSRNSFGSQKENWLSGLTSRATGLHGIWSIWGTIGLISKLKQIQPDIIHLHNLHLWTINIPLLFRYIRKHDIKVIWTLHDCWAFTGHCPHFSYEGCYKWKTGCSSCVRKNQYPFSYVDNTSLMWKLKKKWFSGLDLTVVTPSAWLSSFLKDSFLSCYPYKVINNGIDTNVFKPVENDIKKKYGIFGKKLVLGVALGVDEKKGLDVFIKLSELLDNQKYQVFLVGVDDNVRAQIPSTVISIERTSNQHELAQLYSAADVFVNPTREENYPTVNMEALSCGTPVVTFNTGGSAEMLSEKCGYVVEQNDVKGMIQAIIKVCEEETLSPKECIVHSKQFEKNKRYLEYVKLYKQIYNNEKGSAL